MVGPFSHILSFKPLVLALALNLLVSVEVAAEPPGHEITSQNGALAGILVLRNGNLLSGHIIRLSDHYQIDMPNGQLRVPANQVEMFCRNLEEAYTKRRQQRIGSTADSHLELAQWCMRHKLYKHAAQELRDARAIDSDHRKLARLESRLQHILQNEKARQSQPTAPAPKQTDKSSDTASSKSQSSLNLIQSIPQRERALFVRQIQPMLVKTCATTGCHQSGDARQWQLNHLAVDGAGHPQATLDNFNSTLAQINWQAPQESPLANYARRSHGRTGQSSSKQLSLRQLQLLRAWLEQIATTEAAQDLADVHSEPQIEKRSPQHRLQIPKAGMKIPTSVYDQQPIRTASTAIEDPFDPEAFNRQYARTAEPASEQSPPDGQTDPAQTQPSPQPSPVQP